MSTSYFAGADLSTVDPNPEIVSYGDQSNADQVSQIANVAGSWGATIASIVSGNPVATVAPSSGYQTVRPTTSSNTGALLMVGVLVVVAILILRD